MITPVTEGTESPTGKGEVNHRVAMAGSHCHPEDGATNGRGDIAEAQGLGDN